MAHQLQRTSNAEVVKLLRSVATVYELTGENRFKIIAYERAAETIEHLTREVREIWEQGKLKDVEGVGAHLYEHLDEYFRTGHSKHFDHVIKKIPASVFVLLDVPGLGPKKAWKLVRELHLNNEKTVINDLEKACRENKVAILPTFGKKSQEDIISALAVFRRRADSANSRMNVAYADLVATEIVSYLKKIPQVKHADVMGSLRRGEETVGDIDIAVLANDKDAATIIRHFTDYPHKLRVEAQGEKKAMIIIPPSIHVDMRVQEKETYGAMLQYFTGSKEHNIKLREHALKHNLSISEYGIKDIKNGKLHTFETEEQLYSFLKMSYIPPELRQGKDEIDRALKNDIPRLVELSDIKGDLHVHSNYDLQPSHDMGDCNYRQLLQEAQKRGYEYIGFSDHNPKQSGLVSDDVVKIMKKRYDYIHKNLEGHDGKVKYFIGLEVDILPNGELALPEKAYQYVDYLIASVHSSFTAERHNMTKRITAALSHPKVRIFGHPTARLLGKREGIELEWDAIFALCRKNNIALEINAAPERLDLNDSLTALARTAGIHFVIDTDTHTASHLDNMRYGVSVARRGWCEKKHILNSLPYAQFRKWVEKGKAG